MFHFITSGPKCFKLPMQEIPPTCQGTFNYTIEDIPLRKGAKQRTLTCGTSTCDFNVTQDAHRINLTVLHNGNLLVEDSVYVPAIGESECYYFFVLFFKG